MIDGTRSNRCWLVFLMLAVNVPLQMASQQATGAAPSGAGSGSVLTSTQDVRYLEPASSLVLKGNVVELREIGRVKVRGQNSPEIEASVNILDTLKGKPPGDRVKIRFALDPAPVGMRLRVGAYDLFFLKRQSGEYSLVDPVVAAVPITSREIPRVVAGGSPLEKIQIQLLGSLSDQDPSIQRTALEQINRIGKSESIVVLHGAAESSDPKTRGMAYAGLLYLGDYGLLSDTIHFVNSAVADSDLDYWKRRASAAIGAIGDNRLTEAREAVRYSRVVTCPSNILQVPFNQSVLRQLETLSSSSKNALRESAVHALRGVCDPSSAGALASALDDSDPSVQYDAMMGLAALAGFPSGLPTPAKDAFSQNGANFVIAWKKWWENTGRAKYISRP